MYINEKIKIIGKKVVLVPYEPYHVIKYHDWMEDAELRRMTGSERLTLEEEYNMQQTWRKDENKCTFILLSRDMVEQGVHEIDAMIGDVNVFLSEGVAELEIMVAEPVFQGQGIGTEAIRLMTQYTAEYMRIYNFQVKIIEDNIRSITLFKKLGFEVMGYTPVFKEYTLFLNPSKVKDVVGQDRLCVQPYEKQVFL